MGLAEPQLYRSGGHLGPRGAPKRHGIFIDWSSSRAGGRRGRQECGGNRALAGNRARRRESASSSLARRLAMASFSRIFGREQGTGSGGPRLPAGRGTGKGG